MMEEEGRKWRLQDLGRGIASVFKAIIKGELMKKLDVGQYFPHILYIVFLLGCSIWYGIKFDQTMTRVEDNEKELKELEIRYSNRIFEQRSLNRRTTVAAQLELLGSELEEPSKAATLLKKE